jgi:hypothetical protein
VSFWLRRNRARSGAAAIRWLAVVVVLCQGAAWVHAAASPHVTCVEHGESLHLALLGQAAGQRASDLGDVGGVALGLVDAPADAAAHGHEHCGLQGQGSTSAPAHQRASVDLAVLSTPAPFTAPPRPATALLRLAPKTSPPGAPAV